MALGISIWLSTQTTQFLTIENLSNLTAQAMPIIITSIGQALVVLVGGLDLSVGSVISFTTANLTLGGPAWVLLPAVFALAALIGLTNGFVITRFRVHPIIATLSMQYMILGVTRSLRPVSGGNVPEIVVSAVSGSVFGIPFPVISGVLVILIGWKLMYRARYGLHLFAVGGGVAARQTGAARNFGISDSRTILLADVLCACFAALSGCFWPGALCRATRMSACWWSWTASPL